MASDLVEISGTEALKTLGRSLRSEADGKQLRKDLIADLRTAVTPGVSAVQGQLRAIPHTSTTQSSPALGTYLAARVRTQVRLSGKRAGVAIRIPQTPALRGFRNAARRLNRDGWRHKVFGHDVWVEQTSPIRGYFDKTLSRDKPKYRAAVEAAIEKMVRRVASRH